MSEDKEIDEKKEIIEKADDYIEDSGITNFLYLQAMVEALVDEITIIQKILNDNKLDYKKIIHADADIVNNTWKNLDE